MDEESRAHLARMMKKRKLLHMDMNSFVKGDNEWNLFFQKTLNIDPKLHENKNYCVCYSENGIDTEITQHELDKSIACLTSIPEIYKRLNYPPTEEQKVFLITLAGYLSQNEENFIKTNVNNTYQTLVAISEVNKPTTDLDLKLRYIDMLCSFFEHEAGLKWSLQTNYWAGIYGLVLECQKGEKCIWQRSQNLLSKLIQRTSKSAPKICAHITKQMVQTLTSVALKNLSKVKKLPIEPINPSEYENLVENVKCLVHILESLLASPVAETLKYFINLHVREASDSLAILSSDSDFSLNLNRIMIILSFYEMTELFDGIKVVNHAPIALSGFLRIIERELKKEHLKVILELYYYAQKYWKNVSRKMPKYFVKGSPIDIEDELMSFQVEPLVIIAEKLLGVPQTYEEEIRNCFLADLLNMYSVNCLPLGYEIRERLHKLPLNIEITALECIIKSKGMYSRKNLATVFQVLTYTLRDFIKYVKKYPTKRPFEHDEVLADTLLQAILVYLENFDLSWRESIGSIELTSLVYEFLYYSTPMSSELVIKALKILNTTILKHMSPNMALLVDTTQYSSLNDLGSMLFTKCFNSNAEVRNAALTVVCTVCDKANKGFSSFKNILTEALLLDLILTMSVSDMDRYVRATALKCLQEIVMMDDIGKNLINNGLFAKLLGILNKEGESMVLREAITVITKVYQNDRISEEDTLKFYNAMAQVALRTKYPDVQEHAIKFWEQVTKKHLEKQGMIDDEFPPVIFSKEQKKILRLDDKEIRKRLFKALDSMSKAGCFDVFQSVLQNEKTTKEVFATTVKIVTKLLKLLQQYDVTPEFILLNQTYPNLWSIPSSVIQSPFHYMDDDEGMKEIIEETVMEMINESEDSGHNKFVETNSETGESCDKCQSQHSQISTVDFMDFIYRKLPYLNQD